MIVISVDPPALCIDPARLMLVSIIDPADTIRVDIV